MTRCVAQQLIPYSYVAHSEHRSEVAEHVCVDGTGTEAVNPNIRAKFSSQIPSEIHHAALRSAVGRRAAALADHAENRRDIDNIALGSSQRLHSVLCAKERASEI